MAGMEVHRGLFDQKSAEAILSLKDAFRKVKTLSDWLADNPSNAEGGDILTKSVEEGGFGYTADEAYIIRVTFETFNTVRTEHIPTFEVARKLTGLE